ncbi:hypothetical protein GJ496_004382 [Pomphorhynchus laevis]|nr:hypothetical protein GJ496_004382 [Pomphorhynchus laevis]
MAGVPYDIVNEVPSIGSYADSNGIRRPTAFSTGKINSQYIFEGIVASFMFVLGGMCLICLERMMYHWKADRMTGPFSSYRYIAFTLATAGIFIAHWSLIIFMRIKLPGYL